MSKRKRVTQDKGGIATGGHPSNTGEGAFDGRHHQEFQDDPLQRSSGKEEEEVANNSLSVSEDDEQTALRLEQGESKRKREAARRYLESLQSQLQTHLSTASVEKGQATTAADHDLEVDAALIDEENIKSRLIQDVLQAQGKAFRHLASDYAQCDFQAMHSLVGTTGHPPTCLAFSVDGQSLFVGYKSGDIMQWNVDDGASMRVFHRDQQQRKERKGKGEAHPVKGHRGHVLALAVSPDGQFLVSGGSDQLIIVWALSKKGEEMENDSPVPLKHTADPNDSKEMEDPTNDPNAANDSTPSTSWHSKALGIAAVFTAHRGAVTCLAFQTGTMTLFSGSTDRTVKIWNISQLAYVDTLFGHQDDILSLDALSTERCLTVGARDRTARLWKVAEGTQLVFRAPEDSSSLDLVGAIDQGHFVTGSQEGDLSLWALYRKKPLFSLSHAHEGPIGSLHVVRLGDLIISGGALDGRVKFWAVDTKESKEIRPLQVIDLKGCINGVALAEDENTLAVAIGRDPRLGRWLVHKGVQNRIVLLKRSS